MSSTPTISASEKKIQALIDKGKYGSAVLSASAEGFASLREGDDETALRLYQLQIDAGEKKKNQIDVINGRRFYSVCLGNLGRTSEAKKHLRETISLAWELFTTCESHYSSGARTITGQHNMIELLRNMQTLSSTIIDDIVIHYSDGKPAQRLKKLLAAESQLAQTEDVWDRMYGVWDRLRQDSPDLLAALVLREMETEDVSAAYKDLWESRMRLLYLRHRTLAMRGAADLALRSLAEKGSLDTLVAFASRSTRAECDDSHFKYSDEVTRRAHRPAATAAATKHWFVDHALTVYNKTVSSRDACPHPRFELPAESVAAAPAKERATLARYMAMLRQLQQLDAGLDFAYDSVSLQREARMHALAGDLAELRDAAGRGDLDEQAGRWIQEMPAAVEAFLAVAASIPAGPAPVRAVEHVPLTALLAHGHNSADAPSTEAIEAAGKAVEDAWGTAKELHAWPLVAVLQLAVMRLRLLMLPPALIAVLCARVHAHAPPRCGWPRPPRCGTELCGNEECLCESRIKTLTDVAEDACDLLEAYQFMTMHHAALQALYVARAAASLLDDEETLESVAECGGTLAWLIHSSAATAPQGAEAAGLAWATKPAVVQELGLLAEEARVHAPALDLPRIKGVEWPPRRPAAAALPSEPPACPCVGGEPDAGDASACMMPAPLSLLFPPTLAAPPVPEHPLEGPFRAPALKSFRDRLYPPTAAVKAEPGTGSSSAARRDRDRMHDSDNRSFGFSPLTSQEKQRSTRAVREQLAAAEDDEEDQPRSPARPRATVHGFGRGALPSSSSSSSGSLPIGAGSNPYADDRSAPRRPKPPPPPPRFSNRSARPVTLGGGSWLRESRDADGLTRLSAPGRGGVSLAQRWPGQQTGRQRTPARRAAGERGGSRGGGGGGGGGYSAGRRGPFSGGGYSGGYSAGRGSSALGGEYDAEDRLEDERPTRRAGSSGGQAPARPPPMRAGAGSGGHPLRIGQQKPSYRGGARAVAALLESQSQDDDWQTAPEENNDRSLERRAQSRPVAAPPVPGWRPSEDLGDADAPWNWVRSYPRQSLIHKVFAEVRKRNASKLIIRSQGSMPVGPETRIVLTAPTPAPKFGATLTSLLPGPQPPHPCEGKDALFTWIEGVIDREIK